MNMMQKRMILQIKCGQRVADITHVNQDLFHFNVNQPPEIFFFTNFIFAFSCSLSLNYIPDEDVRFILCAPNFGAAGLPRPLPATSGLALVVGGGAAIAAQGSSSSSAVADLTFKGLAVVFGSKFAAKEVEVKIIIKETC